MTRRILLLIFFIFISHNLMASWKTLFYTDDTKYHLKLYPKGFVQRFRVQKKYCHLIEDAKIVFKNNKKAQTNHFEVMGTQELRKWPQIYGQQNDKFCWFKVGAGNISLNDPKQNLYTIQIKAESQTYYFESITKSIIPSRRLKSSITNWISLGALGPSVVNGGGIFFKLWEPTADEVHLFFNIAKDRPYKMHQDGFNNDRKTHSLFIKNVPIGAEYFYRYLKNGSYENIKAGTNHTSNIKIDPMAKELNYDSKGAAINGYINPRSIIAKEYYTNWKHDKVISSIPKEHYNNWLIYQLWPLAFNAKNNGENFNSGTFKDIAEKINYLDQLGITAVEFLPVHESRFNGSWGYAADSILLIEKNYGKREDLMKLVDLLHSRKIRVIFDVVINHVNNHLIRDPGGIRPIPGKTFKKNNEWGPIPRFSSPYVKKWIADSLITLARDFHVDGYRFDMIKGIYENSPEGHLFLAELNYLLKLNNPKFHNSAEQLPDNVWATYPISQNGLGYDAQWNNKFKVLFEEGFKHYTPKNRHVELMKLASAMKGYSDHKRPSGGEYHFGPPLRTVNYIGCHDVVATDPIIRIVSGYDSPEDLDGNLLERRVRPLSDPAPISAFRKVHNQFTHSFGKLSYGMLLSKPGPLLFFQGEELANDRNIQNEWSYVRPNENNIPTRNIPMNRFISHHLLPWEHLSLNTDELSFLNKIERNSLRGYARFFRDMLHFRKSNPHINFDDPKIITPYPKFGVLTYKIGRAPNEYLIVANFGKRKTKQWIYFPGAKHEWWQEVINSTSIKYGGTTDKYSNIINFKAGTYHNVRANDATFLMYKKVNKGKIIRPLLVRGTFNNWSAEKKYLLKNASDNGSLVAATIKIKKAGIHEFKLGSPNWTIELGKSPTPKQSYEPTMGSLSYIPNLPNAKVQLESGTYNFIFNTENFKYYFRKK